MAAKRKAAAKREAVGYVRVSTAKQDRDAQRKAITEAAAREGYKLAKVIEETVSSRKDQRKIWDVVGELKPGQTLITYELSRLARSIGQVFEVAHRIRKRGASLWVLNPEIRAGNGGDPTREMQADMLLFALSAAAQVERDLIAERTKNALAERKAQGVKLGRPPGRGVKVPKAAEAKGLKPSELLEYYRQGVMTGNGIARLLSLNPRTVHYWIKGEMEKAPQKHEKAQQGVKP